MSNFARKAAIAAVAFATVGSTVFGGAALAVDKKDGDDKKHAEVTNAGGTVGPGGYPTYYCTFAGVVQTSTWTVTDGNPSVLLCSVIATGGDGGTVAGY